MGLFSKKKEEDFFETDDRLIVLNTQQSVCDIYDNVTVDTESVMAPGKNKVPLGDCTVFTGAYGRVYVAKCAELEYIENTERLAKLEQSIVLKALVEFNPVPKDNPNKDLKFWAMSVACIIAIFM